jgi:hypothetical protein
LLNATRSRRAAKHFFRKVLGGNHVTAPRVINVDKNPTYIGAVRDLKREKLLREKCKRRPSQYINNINRAHCSLRPAECSWATPLPSRIMVSAGLKVRFEETNKPYRYPIVTGRTRPFWP